MTRISSALVAAGASIVDEIADADLELVTDLSARTSGGPAQRIAVLTSETPLDAVRGRLEQFDGIWSDGDPPEVIVLRAEIAARGRWSSSEIAAAPDLFEENQRLERELDAAHRFLERIIDSVPDPVFVKDEAHRWILLNDAFCKLLGKSPTMLLGKSDYDFFPKEEADVFWQKDELAFRTGVTNENEESFTDGDGVRRTIVTRKATFVDERGRKILVGTIRDVTAKRAMERQLVASERMASVGTLAAGIAHEINNPLAYVISNLEYLDEQLASKLDGDDRTALEDATHGARRVAQIVRDLKSFSHPEEPDRSDVDVAHVLEVALRMTSNVARHKARILTDFRPTPPVVAAESRLGQVFVNLIINAVQAFDEGEAARNEIRVACGTSDDGGAFVSVTDNGPGIGPEVIDRIFDPFFTTKPVGVGTGLGLSICHGIVTSLGGRIEVRSEPGRGASFVVRLPSAEGEAVRSRRRTSAKPKAEGHAPERPRLLIVDDEPQVRRALSKLLERQYDVTTAEGSSQVLALLEGGATFALVLCDLMMPGMNAIELYERVARMPSPPLFVLLTGGAFTPQTQAFLERTELPVLRKPIDANALRAFIHDLLAKSAIPVASSAG